jgi:hypothetical protein
MGLMNLLKADFTQSVGKVTGARWKGVSVIKTKIDYKAAPTALQTKSLRTYELYLRLVAAVYAQIKASKRFLPPNMSLFNWAASKNKYLMGGKSEFQGQIDLHAPVKSYLFLISAYYDTTASYLEIAWSTQFSIEQYNLVNVVITLHDEVGYKLAVVDTPIDTSTGILTVAIGPLLKNPAFVSVILFGTDRRNCYCNGSMLPVNVGLSSTSAPPTKRAIARGLDLPNMELGNNIFEGEKNGKDEPAKSKLGRKGRANRRRKVEKPIDD